MSISSPSSISVSLHSGVASAISCSKTNLSHDSSPVHSKLCLVCLAFIPFVIVGKSSLKGTLIGGGAGLKIFTLGEGYIRGARSFEEILYLFT